MPHIEGDGQSSSKTLNFEVFSNIINGVQSSTTKKLNGINPSTLEENPAVPASTADDVDSAVSAARAAFISWAQTPWDQRRDAIIDFSKALLEVKEDFAKLLVREQGKPFALALNEIESGVKWLEVQANLTLPNRVVEESDERKIVTRYTPLGVSLAIVPWNFPFMLACGKIAPALLTGNVCILKPSPFTPYCGLKLVELGQKFFPPGVLQVLSGGDDLGPLLTEHPGIDKVSFTGSTATGKLVMKSCSKTLKRITLELGGNDPAIVCGDVDIEQTAQMVTRLALLNSGQICVAIKRVYVHSSIYDDFLRAMVRVAESLTVGDGHENVDLGPVQNSMQFHKVQDLLARSQDFNIVTGAQKSAKVTDRMGYFITPTIIANPPDSAQIVTQEPFGPVFPVMKWDTDDEVLKRANDSDVGLGASIWTKDLQKAEAMAARLDAGTIWINSHVELRPDAAFGGHKQSGIGSEWGAEGLRAYCNIQTLFLKKK